MTAMRNQFTSTTLTTHTSPASALGAAGAAPKAALCMTSTTPRMALSAALAIVLALALTLTLSSCTAPSPTSGPGSVAEIPTSGEPTKDSPIVIDKASKTIHIYTDVNGTYFTESTRHGVVFKGGSNGEKSILRGYADEKLFYQALIELGAKAGDNLTAADMKAAAGAGKSVEGDILTVTVSFGDTKNLPFEKIVKASEQRPMVIHFGGNLASAEKNNTGCVLCLDSCATGITSNSAWETGATENNVVKFYGDKDILPADGSPVIVSFKLA